MIADNGRGAHVAGMSSVASIAIGDDWLPRFSASVALQRNRVR